jgi:hypothetical protein
MKRNFMVSLFGGFVGFGLLLILLVLWPSADSDQIGGIFGVGRTAVLQGNMT